MKWFVLICVCLCLFVTETRAETAYVGDVVRITLRSGQGIDHKILDMIGSGQQVEILDKGDQWTYVQLPNGKQGWVLSRFLTGKKPAFLELEDLKNKHKLLMSKVKSLLEKNTKLKEENKDLKSKLDDNEKKLDEISNSYDDLKKDSAEFLELKANHSDLSSRFAEQIKKSKTMEEMLVELQKNQNIKWVIVGASVLLVGFIIGFGTRRQRKRSSLL